MTAPLASYNGVPATDTGAGIDQNFTIPWNGQSISFPGGLLDDPDLKTIMTYYHQQLWARVEPPDDAPSYRYDVAGFWGYEYRQNRNANNLSCHSSGSALDNNAVRHPNGDASSYTAAQQATIAQIIDAELDCVLTAGIPGLVGPSGRPVGWSAGATPDFMHVESTDNDRGHWAAVASKIRGQSAPPTPPPPTPAPTPTVPTVPEDDMFSDADRALLAGINAALHAPAQGVTGPDGKPSNSAGDILAALLRQSQASFNQSNINKGAVLAAVVKAATAGGTPEQIAEAVGAELGK